MMGCEEAPLTKVRGWGWAHFRFRLAAWGRDRIGGAVVAGLSARPGKCQLLMSLRWRMLYLIVLLQRQLEWATQNLLNSLANPHKPGPLPTSGTTPLLLPPQLRPDYLQAHPPLTSHLDRHPLECILPCPLEHLLLSLLLDPLVLLVLPTHPLVPFLQGSTRHRICPFQSFHDPMAGQRSQLPPLLLLGHGDPCPLAVGVPQLGASILHPACHIHPLVRIPLQHKHQGLHRQCHGELSLQDRGDRHHLAHFLPPQGPTQLRDCIQHHLILTKCHLLLLGHHPCLVALILTVELVAD